MRVPYQAAPRYQSNNYYGAQGGYGGYGGNGYGRGYAAPARNAYMPRGRW